MPPRSNKNRQVQSARNKLRAGERSAKAPSKNIGDQVGGWLGGAAKVVGRAAAQNPLVAQNVKYGRAVMAGPTAVAKTVAIDLAAGAVSRGLGYGASKGLSRIKQRFVEDIGVHVSKTPNLKEITYSANRANTGMKEIEGSPLVKGMTYKISGFPADAPLRGFSSFKVDGEKFTNKLYPAKPKLNVGFGRRLDPESMAGSGYSAGENTSKSWSMYVTKSKTGRLDPEKANRYDRITPRQEVLSETRFPAYGRSTTGKFVDSKETQRIADQQQAQVVKKIMEARKAIATRQNVVAARVGEAAGIAGVVVPKKKGRGGGKNKK
jgi:hypothetical protein